MRSTDGMGAKILSVQWGESYYEYDWWFGNYDKFSYNGDFKNYWYENNNLSAVRGELWKEKVKDIKIITNFSAIIVLKDKTEIFIIKISVIVILIIHILQDLYFMEIIFLMLKWNIVVLTVVNLILLNLEIPISADVDLKEPNLKM